MTYNIVDVRWYATESTVGIVIIDTGHGLKGYIGSPPAPFGMDEDADVQWLAGHGTRMHEIEALKILFPALADKEWYIE